MSEQPPSPGRILLIDDDEVLCDFLGLQLERRGATVVAERSAEAGLERLAAEDFDVVLCDLHLVGLDGLAFTQEVARRSPQVPVVVITGAATMDTTIAAMRAGAWDFLLKPIDLDLLAVVLDRAAKHRALQGEVVSLRRQGRELAGGLMVGTTPSMKRVYELIDRVAPGDAPVMICGASGTGKELVAAALHAASTRKAGPFVAVNCAAVPAALLESELFGHARGAFTDAKRERKGLFAQADGGTLFLDEIAELPLELQPKLLRALQERRVRPLGGTGEIAFDARLITATNRDLDTEVHERRFREDLFYRINVVRIDVPPLRERHADIVLLARHFLARAAARAGRPLPTLAPAAAEKLLAYEWPGNVRELENCIESAVAVSDGPELNVSDLPAKLRDFQSQRVVLAADSSQDLVTLAELSQRYLNRVLTLLSGNKTRAAQVLGVDRRTLYRMLARGGPSA